MPSAISHPPRLSRRRMLGSALATSLTGATTRIVGASQDSASNYVQSVVTVHRSATDAGIAVLNDGGTAADAAVAVAAVLSVVEGWFSSVLGGGTWGLYYHEAAGALTSLDGVGPTGSLASRADFATRAGDPGIHQSNVPGAWDGWMMWLQAYGQLDLDRLLAPAISLARNGHEASDALEEWAARLSGQIESSPDARRIYMPEDELPKVGDAIVMSDLANTFQSLIDAYESGLSTSRDAAIQAARDYYYRGPIAEAIVEFSNEGGGYLTIEDFTNFSASMVTPLSIVYRDDIEVFENPPNSQGITMLLALNILKKMDLASHHPDNPDVVHMQVEAMKLAFADRYALIGDPARIDIPVNDLLSDTYAARQRDRIDMTRAMTWPINPGMQRANIPDHTTTFQITDRYGNAAAVTTSLGAQFLIVPGSGIHMNNRMRMLSIEPGNANELTPGYKVRHTSCPYMVFKGGRPWILGGNTGADTQPQAQAQQFLSAVEFGLNPREAISRSRWVTTAFPSGTYEWDVGNQLRIQEGFYEPVIDALRNRGHDIVVGEGTFGAANMLAMNDGRTDAEFGVEPDMALSAGIVIPSGA